MDLGDRWRSSGVPLVQSPTASTTSYSSDPRRTDIEDGETRTLWGRRWLLSSAVDGMAATAACCVSVWRRRSTLRWNALEHTRHANGLNPVCLRLWVMRFDDWLKALPHWRHTYGFSPATDKKCGDTFNFISKRYIKQQQQQQKLYSTSEWYFE